MTGNTQMSGVCLMLLVSLSLETEYFILGSLTRENRVT